MAKQPTGLGAKARALWRAITTAYTLRPDELSILEDICREVDLIERLETELREGPLTVRGSMGQQVASPLVQEIRQHRAVKARLLGGLALPDEDKGNSEAARSQAGRELVTLRWGRRGA